MSPSENENLDEKERIILRLLEEGYNTKEISQRLGYKDRDSVGKYMRRRGYKWNDDKEIYIKDDEENDKFTGQKIQSNYNMNDSKKQFERESRVNNDRSTNQTSKNSLNKEEIAQLIHYLPTMKLMHDNQKALESVLNSFGNSYSKNDNANSLPRYLIEGKEVPKTINLPQPLENLLDNYCEKFRISKKEIIVIALVEFFRKYGRKKEIDEILGG